MRLACAHPAVRHACGIARHAVGAAPRGRCDAARAVPRTVLQACSPPSRLAARARSIARTPLPWILWTLRILNLGNAVLLGMAAFQSFFIIDGSVTRTFLMVYQALFGLLLALFELRVGSVARWVKRQFGFMFTFSGRLVFLIFVGAVCFGMIHTRPANLVDKTEIENWEYSSSWVLGVGIGTMANALINAFVVCSHPYFRDDPKAAMTDDEVEKYLKAHPDAVNRIANADAKAATGPPPAAAAPAAAAAAAPAAAPRADFGASGAGYTPPVPPRSAPKDAGGFTGSADGGATAAEVDPFSAAPSTVADPWGVGGGDDEDDDDNPFA